MRKLILIVTMMLVMAAGAAYAAGSSVVDGTIVWNGDTGKLVVTITSDSATGAASGAISDNNMVAMMGKRIELVKCAPNQVAATKPTYLYDLTITDADGLDVMGGSLANRTNAAGGDQALPFIGTDYGPRQITSPLTINATNMGNSKITVCTINLSR